MGRRLSGFTRDEIAAGTKTPPEHHGQPMKRLVGEDIYECASRGTACEAYVMDGVSYEEHQSLERIRS